MVMTVGRERHARVVGRLGAVLLLLAASACGDQVVVEPEAVRYAIEVHGGDGQLGAVDSPAPASLDVRVTEAETGDPIEDAVVDWRVIEGDGASVVAAASLTDSTGVASVDVRLGADTGTYRFVARTNRHFGRHATFTLHAILAPTIDGIEPASAAPGDTVTLTGDHFDPEIGGNIVLFGGFPGLVVESEPRRVRAVVPECLPARTVEVTAQRGGVVGVASPLEIEAGAPPGVSLAVGEVRRFDADALECLRIADQSDAAAYLVVPQNVASVPRRPMPFRMVGLAGAAPPPPVERSLGDAWPSRSPPSAAAGWEARIRQRERLIPPGAVARPEADPDAAGDARRAVVPEIGDRDTFSVLNKDEEFVDVVAEVRYVSEHAVLYQDIDAPDGGFESAHFERFGQLFDDPIHSTTVDAFGEPSDIDGNGRIIVLFTPVVNELTERGGSGGFVAGFFFGFDLTEGLESNRAEIFYSVVPDPAGEFSDERSASEVLRVVPGVLAHEFQHMIAFHQRRLRDGSGVDVLWLAEGLAHMAEDLVAEAFFERGDTLRGAEFVLDNIVRAHLYLRDPAATSLVDDERFGTLEMRGAAWMMVKYLAGHHGGNDLLRDLTQTALEGVENVEAATGLDWPEAFQRFSVALWADDPDARAGATVDPAYTFANMALRAELEHWFAFAGGDPDAAFPLAPVRVDYDDLAVVGDLPASSPGHVLVTADAGPVPSLSMAVTSSDGQPLASAAVPQLTLLRYR
ncbi:MAG: IPT/TIG domain-containing protein [Gemmatimonadota bacterium]